MDIVKPLQWEDQTNGGASMSGRSKRHIRERAATAFSAYFLEHDTDDDSWWVVENLLGDEIAGPFVEDWQARQAAQDYHAECILSTLMPVGAAASDMLEVLHDAAINNMVVEDTDWWKRVYAALAKAEGLSP